jgi:hypothetical protein
MFLLKNIYIIIDTDSAQIKLSEISALEKTW